MSLRNNTEDNTLLMACCQVPAIPKAGNGFIVHFLAVNLRKVHGSLALSSAMFRQETFSIARHTWKPRGTPIYRVPIKMTVFIFLYVN